MRRIALSAIGFLMLAGLVGYAVTNVGGDDAELAAVGPPEEQREAGTVVDLDAAGEAGAEPAPAAAIGPSGAVAELPGLPQIGASIVRTASLTIEVAEDGFGEAFGEASFIAGKYGGYVESSSTAGTNVRRGDLLIRVPSDSFDEAMRDLRGLGEVQRLEFAGRDVTSEFVDLEARLLTWEAQEAVLLDLMAQATSVEATLRVQRELQDVQFRIEQIKGQLRVLENQTDLATIHVSLHEPGAPAALPDSTRPSLGEAWERAVDGFLGVWYAVVVGLGFLVPIAALVLVAWLGFRRFLQPRPTGVS